MSNDNPKTNGRSKSLVARLESAVRDAIDQTYLTGERHPNGARVTRDTDEARAIRDYVRNQAMLDKWEDLIAREAAHERRHRRGAPDGFRYPISVQQSARIIVLGQFASGAQLDACPGGAMYLQCRDTAFEAEVVGWLARGQVGKELLAELEALDYATAVRS